VLLSFSEYQKITKKGKNILEMIATPGAGDFEFDPPRLGEEPIQSVDFS
jgi:hypothetical protein